MNKNRLHLIEIGEGRVSMIALQKKLIIVLSMLLSSNAYAMKDDGCACNKVDIKFTECPKAKVQSVTWWDWLTNNESTQLHFYQLIELLHTTSDGEVNESTVAVNQKKPKQDKL